MSDLDAISSIELFRDVPAELRAEIGSCLLRRDLARGQVLITRGDPSDSMFVVISGRFTVHVAGGEAPVAEIGAGEPIGELGFFADLPRSATVVAARDANVLELDRASFYGIARKAPLIYNAILAAMARRLVETTARTPGQRLRDQVRTVAIVGAGDAEIPAPFIERLRSVMERRSRVLFLAARDVASRFPERTAEDVRLSYWLNAQEADHDLIVYIADTDLTAWSRTAVHQADQVLIIATGNLARPPGVVEAFAFGIHPTSRRRLVRLHTRRRSAVEGTAAWLAGRDVFMHHHVALDDDSDTESLYRFLTGRAIGFVAGGGGSYGSAHIGIFQAFEERGVKFDIVGGTSAGAAMMAGVAFLGSTKVLTDGTEDIFIKSRSLERPTLPKYALLDHVAFDAALKRQYRGYNVEDTWRNYFALSTDLSRNAPYVHRSGPLWRAVRASTSLPGVLPPLYEQGHMLVDGGLIDNVPLATMRQIKTGPNVVVHFGMPELELFDVDYDSIPGRWRLLVGLLSPFHRRWLPSAPGPANVLRRSLFANQRRDLLPVGPDDLVMQPPAVPGTSFMKWDRHLEVYEASYRWAQTYIEELVAMKDPAMMAILRASDLT